MSRLCSADATEVHCNRVPNVAAIRPACRVSQAFVRQRRTRTRSYNQEVQTYMSQCPFCSLAPGRKWIEKEDALAFPDAYPVTDGHALVIPRKHVSSIYELNANEQAALWDLVGEVRERLLASLKPDGFNIGVNDGLTAGQTIDHAHVHVIPRRKGDVPDPRGGIRWIIDDKASYWNS
jgi:diadenosine tetraphosphate (Ap4A) HIT family hydrolase